MSTRDDGFLEGYQDALSDIASAYIDGGIAKVIEWLDSNITLETGRVNMEKIKATTKFYPKDVVEFVSPPKHQ